MSKTFFSLIVMLPVSGLLVQGSARADEIAIPFTDGCGIRNCSLFISDCFLTVGTVGADDRIVLEYDISQLPPNVESVTWASTINNFELGQSEIDILEFYSYAGDDVVEIDECDAGDLFASVDHTVDPPTPPAAFIFVDVTGPVLDELDAGQDSFGLRVSTSTHSVWVFGTGLGVGSPDPFLVVQFAESTLEQHEEFVGCVAGPGSRVSDSCADQFDSDGDSDVDMDDFVVFQRGFGVGVGYDVPELDKCVQEALIILRPSCFEDGWGAVCQVLADEVVAVVCNTP